MAPTVTPVGVTVRFAVAVPATSNVGESIVTATDGACACAVVPTPKAAIRARTAPAMRPSGSHFADLLMLSYLLRLFTCRFPAGCLWSPEVAFLAQLTSHGPSHKKAPVINQKNASRVEKVTLRTGRLCPTSKG